MSEHDYLHDPTASPDPEVRALERALRPLRLADTRASERVLAVPPRSTAPRWPWLLAAAAAAAAVLIAWWLGPDDQLGPGAAPRSYVAAAEPLTVRVDDRITLQLEAGSELAFVHWRDDELRFRLLRGGLAATVAPPPAVPPRFFVVETPGARVVDQGCRYELRVAEDASQRVLVTEGAVTFADDQREVFVPAGAIARLDQRGVGTPVFLDADPALKKLFDAFDRQRGGDDQRRLQDLVRKIEATAARPADTLPVWHLLAEPDGEVRKVATEILYELAGSPDGGPIGMFTAEQWLAHLRLAAWQVGG